MIPTWKAGEHMAIVGMTGSGKSVLMAYLLDQCRKRFIVLKTKADSVKYPQATTVTKASQISHLRHARWVLRPRSTVSRNEFGKTLQLVWREGGWTIAIDELYYLDAKLGLGEPIDELLTQGREPGKISVCCGMQRPTIVTRFAIGEATHVVCFGMEGRDAKILRDATSARVAQLVGSLPQYHFVWYYVPDRSIWRGRLDIQTGQLVGSHVHTQETDREAVEGEEDMTMASTGRSAA